MIGLEAWRLAIGLHRCPVSPKARKLPNTGSYHGYSDNRSGADNLLKAGRLALVVILLLLIVGNVEMNPGPAQPETNGNSKLFIIRFLLKGALFWFSHIFSSSRSHSFPEKSACGS